MFAHGSRIDALDVARVATLNRFQRRRYTWQQVFQRVARRHEHHNKEARHLQVLLELQILVARNEDFKARGESLLEKGAVLQPRPALLLGRSNVVADEVRGELTRQLLIEEDAHFRSQRRVPLRGQRWPARASRTERRPGTPRGCSRLPNSQSDSGSGTAVPQ